MSFRELRDFTEYMRVLNYPRLVSVDNFRTPNFGLVADILYWMVHRYDPTASISDDISTEDCRVEFLTTVAQVMVTKAGVKLNTKRLYSADGKAVKELLKVAHLLYAAHKANVEKATEQEEGKAEDVGDVDNLAYASMQGKLPDVKATRKLASSITESGAKLFDLLNEEREVSPERQRCLRFLERVSNNLDSTTEQKFVEQKLQDLLGSARDHVGALEKQCEDLASDEKTLQVKIKKKQSELERNDKRLKSLQSVRPAFMDEYEKLEGELARQYEVYLEKFRNLDYLEHRLEAFNRKAREKLEESERTRKRIQMQAVEKRARDLRGEEDEHLFADDGQDSGDDNEEIVPTQLEGRKPQGASGNNNHNNNNNSKRKPDEESELSAESDLSDDDSLSEESSLSGSLSEGDDDDLIDDDDEEDDDDLSVSEGSEEGDGPGNGSNSELSDEDSDDNF